MYCRTIENSNHRHTFKSVILYTPNKQNYSVGIMVSQQ